MNVEIYSRPGCKLCEEAKAILLEVQENIAFELLEVDIEKDPLLLERFKHDIPVVFIDGRKLFKHRIDRAELITRLERARSFSLGTLNPQKTLSRTAPVSRATKGVFAVVAIASLVSVFVAKGYTKLVLDEERALAGLELSAEDRPAPDFELETPDGAKRTLADFKGQVVLLNFYATWCGPCREEMPSMSQLAKTMKGEKFTLLAVDVQEDWPTVNRFFGTQRPAFQLGLDPTGKIAQAYEQKQGLMFPETFVIDPQGRVVGRFEGPRDWTQPAAIHYLRKLSRS